MHRQIIITMADLVHSLNTDILPPRQFTYPFCYEPHPLCIAAAKEVQRYIEESGVWAEEKGPGKMFGVLCVRVSEKGKGKSEKGKVKSEKFEEGEKGKGKSEKGKVKNMRKMKREKRKVKNMRKVKRSK